MKCQILFAGKNNKYIMDLLSAEFAHSTVAIKQNMFIYIYIQIKTFMIIHFTFAPCCQIKIQN